MSVTAARGFVAAGGPIGVKDGGRPDCAVVAAEGGRAFPAAGVFTQNFVAAAPVDVSRQHLTSTKGRAAGVVLTSGNANAATGTEGIDAAEGLCRIVAEGIGAQSGEIVVCQTGLIGIPFPFDAVAGAVPGIVKALAPDREAAHAAAEAIMTTDTFAKETLVEAAGFVVGGMAKGAAMLAPNMATMLAVLTTDAIVDPITLQGLLSEAVKGTFNAMTIDGCTSTNDTVLVLASGESGKTAPPDTLGEALTEGCRTLAEQMAADAEGATKIARVLVTSARTAGEARQVARKIAESQLVKCSWNGEDPYWGRVVSEVGTAGVSIDPTQLVVAYGGIVVSRGCVEVDHDRNAVADHMKQREISLSCDLGSGSAEAMILTTDLGVGYIDENRTTS